MSDESTKQQEICVIFNQLKSLYKMMATESFHVGFALILIGCVIAIFTIIGIIYHCYMWSRFKSREKQPKKVSVESQPHSKVYEPIYVKPLVKSLKEYETQMLEMSVPIVDDSTSFEENIYEKIGPKIPDMTYASRSEMKVNEIINGNTCSPAPHMPKNPLYCEILEESSQTHTNSERLFSGENIYSTTSRDKTTEL